MNNNDTSKNKIISKISIFIPNLRGGGAERVMLTLANNFAMTGYDVDLVLGTAKGEYLSEVSSEVRIIDFKSKRAIYTLIPFAKYLISEKPKAVLSALNYINIIAIIAKLITRSKTRLVISERNSLTSMRNGLATRLLYKGMKIFYPFADAIIAVSKAGAHEITNGLGIDRKKVFSIPNPINIEEIKKLAKQKIDHPQLVNKSTPIILAVGRLNTQKNYSMLINSFAKLLKYKNAHLIILGEGPLRDELESLIKQLDLIQNISLLGFQSNPFKWMARCDIFVLSSLYEGFPNVLVQAMACNAKIISTDCQTGPNEILDEGRYGKLVPVNDVDALANSMIESLADSKIPNYSAKLTEYMSDKISQSYCNILLNLPKEESLP